MAFLLLPVRWKSRDSQTSTRTPAETTLLLSCKQSRRAALLWYSWSLHDRAIHPTREFNGMTEMKSHPTNDVPGQTSPNICRFLGSAPDLKPIVRLSIVAMAPEQFRLCVSAQKRSQKSVQERHASHALYNPRAERTRQTRKNDRPTASSSQFERRIHPFPRT